MDKHIQDKENESEGNEGNLVTTGIGDGILGQIYVIILYLKSFALTKSVVVPSSTLRS